MGKREPVSAARIAQMSATIADEIGLEYLTMAAVAKQLEISVPGLYKHVPSLAAVRRDIALLGISELVAAISKAAVGRSGAGAIQAAASAYRDYAKAFPGRYAASVQAPPPGDGACQAASDQAVGVMVAVLGAYELDRDDAIDAVRMFRAIVHGFVSLELAGGFGLPQSVDATFSRLIETYVHGLEQWQASSGEV